MDAYDKFLCVVVLFVLDCTRITSQPSKRPLNFLKTYELTSIHQVLSHQAVENREASLTVTLDAFGNNFQMELVPERTPPSKLTIHGKKGVEKRDIKSEPQIFVGHETNRKGSIIIAFAVQSGFGIVMEEGNVTYYVEPSSFYFSDVDARNSSVVYRASDIKCDEKPCFGTMDYITLDRGRYKDFLGPSQSQFLKSNLRDIQESPRKNCAIELVADHTFVARLNYNIRDVITMLFFYAKQADRVFKMADFDNDGVSDNVRIVPSQLVIYYNELEPSYPFSNLVSNDAAEMIKTFSRRSQNFCLSVCFCHRTFSSHVIGIAFKSDPKTSIGGICQRQVASRSEGIITANTALVSTRGYNGPVPFSVTSFSFTHELGHCFGSSHDSPDDPICSPGGDQGNYLMSPYVINGEKLNHARFSPCSRTDIHRTIRNTGQCLMNVFNPTCGNGVREGDEECDCGYPMTCDQIDPCCTPKGGVGTDRECTIRRESGAVCSYMENACCDDKCKIVGASLNRICSKEFALCRATTCDGISAECPSGRIMKDGIPCRGTSKTCSRGECNSSVCLDHGLYNCNCHAREECHVCCYDPFFNKCRTSKSLGYMVSSVTPYVKPTGLPCNFKHGMCNIQGECQAIETSLKDIFRFLNNWVIAGLFLIVFIYIAAHVIVIIVKASRKRAEKRRKQIIIQSMGIGDIHRGPATAPCVMITDV